MEITEKEKVEKKSIRFPSLDTTDKIVIGIILLIGLFVFFQVSQFKHIPGPIYGGDLYMIRGFTQAILQGNAPWKDPYFAGHYAYYGWLAYLITAVFVKATGVGLEKMSTLLPAFIQIVFLWVSYKFGTRFFKDKKYGIIFMLSVLSMRIVDIKISGGFATLFMLLTFWSWMEFESGKKNYKYLTGVFMGLTALSHIISFICVAGMMGLTLVFEGLSKAKKGWKSIIKFIGKYYQIFVIALLIALLLVAPWIFVYHMNTLNKTQQYSLQDINKSGVGWVFRVVWNLFIRTTDPVQFIWGLVVLLGLVFCLMNKKRKEQRFILIWFAAAVLLASHYLITAPLFDNWIVPGHLWGGSAWLINLIFFVYGLKNIELMFKIDRKILHSIFIIFILIVSYQSYQKFNANRWVQYGREIDGNMQVMFETEDWLLTNTQKDDVFLANDESAFALNALSGRHVVTVRRTHASYYVDVEKRYADAIVMLYGNNKEATINLLEEYSVDYVYVDSFLARYPMITSLEHEQYLINNGINYTIQNVRLDPSTADAPSYDSIVVPPQELKILTYNLTKPVKQFTINQQAHSALYKVEPESYSP